MSIPNPPYHETINKLLYAILQHFEGNPIPMNLPLPPYYNVTQSLLYEILLKLNGAPVVFTGIRVLYVSSRYGDNATAEVNNINRPFKTITAAKNNAFFGDVIHVMEGTYDEGNLCGNYNYWFDFGSKVEYSGTGAIFQQMYGECLVRGYGVFRCFGLANVINVGNWYNCVLDIECESIEASQRAIVLGQNRPLGDPTFYKPHRIKARRAYSSQKTTVEFAFNVHGEIEIDEIISDSIDEAALQFGNVKKGIVKNSHILASNFCALLFDASVDVTIDHCEIVCNYNSPLGHGIIFFYDGSNIAINNTRIILKHVDAKSIYTDLFCNLKIDNNVIANRDTGGTFSINYLNKGNKIILENNEATIDITGLTSIDLTNYQNAEIIRLSSTNPTETINEVIAAPKHHSYKLVPIAGLVLSVTSTDPLTATETSIILETPSLSLDGDQGDWIELYNGIFGTGNKLTAKANY